MAWYFGIATEGYRFGPNNRHRPAEHRLLSGVPDADARGRAAARRPDDGLRGGGTLIALGGFFWGLTYLFRLARELLADDEAAATAVWMIAAVSVCPVFRRHLHRVVLPARCHRAFYHFRRRELVKAGAWGLVVGLTRPNGAFLSIPLALIAVSPWLPRWLAGGLPGNVERDPSRRSFRALMPAMAAAAMPGIGVLLYSAFIWQLTGNPLAWAEGHAAWGREYRGLGVLVVGRSATSGWP